MSSKVTAAVVAAGAASAVLYGAVLVTGLNAVPFAFFAQLPLFVAGLSFGWPAAALAGGVGSAGIAALGGLSLAATFAAMLAAPVAILCQRALRHRIAPDGSVEWYPSGRLAGDATLLALAVAFAQAILLASLGDEVQALLRGRFDPGAALTSEDEAMREVLRAVAPVLPGFAGGQWLWMLAINGALGQWIARRAGTASRPSPRMAELELPGWMTGLFALALLGSLFPGLSGAVGANAIVVLLAAYTLGGLAIVHAAAAQWTSPVLALTAVYLASLLTLGMPLLPIAAAGVLEPWIKLRARITGRGRKPQ
jgi:hypothetical protein